MSTMACYLERRRGGALRQYNRSETPRIRWTEELHSRFIQAVDALGGEKEATPKQILRVMGVKGVSISHVKSHLQMYRIASNQAELPSLPSGERTKERKRMITRHDGSFYRPPLIEDSLHEFNLPSSRTFHPTTESIQTVMLNQDNKLGYFEHDDQGGSTDQEMNCELTLSSFDRQKKLTAGREESECVSSVDGDASSTGGIRRDCIALDDLNLELTISSPSCHLILQLGMQVPMN